MGTDAGDPINQPDFSGRLNLLDDEVGDLQVQSAAYATQIDGLSSDIVARLGGKDGAIVGYDGTINPTTDQGYWDAGSTVGAVDGNGELPISFATAYPNGVLEINVSNGDGNASVFIVAPISHDNGGFVARCTTDCTPPTGTPLPGSTNVPLNWSVLGW